MYEFKNWLEQKMNQTYWGHVYEIVGDKLPEYVGFRIEKDKVLYAPAGSITKMTKVVPIGKEPWVKYFEYYDDPEEGFAIVTKTENRAADTVPIDLQKNIYYLITRKSGGLATPGGMIDPGENWQQGALRELAEEANITSKDIQWVIPLSSAPMSAQDPREHTVTMPYAVFMKPEAKPVAGDDAAAIDSFPIDGPIPSGLAFEHHKEIIQKALDVTKNIATKK